MLSKVWLFRVLILAAIAVSATSISSAQCLDEYETTLYYSNFVIRDGGNDVWTYAGSDVEGDYYYNWYCTVTMSEYKDGFIFQGRQDVYGEADFGGDPFLISYHDALSSPGNGPGTYTIDTYHTWECYDDYYGLYYFYDQEPPSESLGVQRPAIDSLGLNGVWWLGSAGASDPANGYYGAASLVALKNCNAGDSCPEVPGWTVIQNPQKLMLSNNPGNSVVGTATEPSTSIGDVQIVFNIGGFYSAPLSFTVNRPYYFKPFPPFTYNSYSDTAGNKGWQSFIYYRPYDRFNNEMPSISFNETFPDTPVEDEANDWPWGPAVGAAGWPPGGYVIDLIRLSGPVGTLHPEPLAPQFPFLLFEAVDHRTQIWRVGSNTPGSGVLVQRNILQRFIDHGDHEDIVTPLIP